MKPNNLTATISDHLSRFARIAKTFGNTASNKSNIYKKGCSFIFDYVSIDRDDSFM